MIQFRIIEKENCYGQSKFYVQEKGLLWGWNYVKGADDMALDFRTKESALRTIRSWYRWYGYKYNKIVNIIEVPNERTN